MEKENYVQKNYEWRKGVGERKTSMSGIETGCMWALE